MTATAELRGRYITFINSEWIYSDTKEPVYPTRKYRFVSILKRFINW